MVSFTISALFLAVVVYLIYKTLKTDRGALVSLSWLISLYLPWILISLVFGRLTYVYYMYPVVGAVCIGIGLGLSNFLDWWEDNVKGRFRNTAGIVVISYLALHLAIFLMLSSLLPPLGKWL
jgi:dolichyl-phosphate-mannose--protein O-mannosyl transferase